MTSTRRRSLSSLFALGIGAAVPVVAGREKFGSSLTHVLRLLALLAVLGEDGAPVVGGLWQPVFEALQVLCDRYDK